MDYHLTGCGVHEIAHLGLVRPPVHVDTAFQKDKGAEAGGAWGKIR